MRVLDGPKQVEALPQQGETKMQKKFNFIYKGKLIDVYAEHFTAAEIIAKQIMTELDQLEKVTCKSK